MKQKTFLLLERSALLAVIKNYKLLGQNWCGGKVIHKTPLQIKKILAIFKEAERL